ncbi:hypothetical protein DEO72_LG2g2243 [Vigna unguiculata]|uniref:Uncharacterized protein n=1 Tax=Vigna unguiculata TaxID=3917 RepID=A0A4D6KWP2_VIGUN|nr:hypothetical protein DEO72_LG2g2243 [Vigna unguiculata]
MRDKLLLLNSKAVGPQSEPDRRPGFHQTAASLLSLSLPEVLTSAHINKVDDHRKGGNHTQSYKQAKGSPRSGERGALAQAADSRLGETTTVALENFVSSRLGEAVSPERDSSSLKNIAHRLGERSSRKTRRVLAILA